jgi:hypothetical protein
MIIALIILVMFELAYCAYFLSVADAQDEMVKQCAKNETFRIPGYTVHCESSESLRYIQEQQGKKVFDYDIFG